MTLKKILQENPQLTIRGFQRLQAEYDDRFISALFSGFNKVRHTYAHLGKLIGRVAGYIHDVEEHGEGNVSAEDIRTKVIPDLLVYSAWLAKEFDVDIEDAYLTRFIGNINRLHADEISSEELAELEKDVADKISRKD